MQLQMVLPIHMGIHDPTVTAAGTVILHKTAMVQTPAVVALLTACHLLLHLQAPVIDFRLDDDGDIFDY